MWGDDGEGMGWMEPMTRSKKIILGSSRHVWVRRLIVLSSRGFSMYKGSRCIHSPGHAHLSACSHMMVPDVTSIATSLSGFEVAHWRWARRPVLGRRHFDEDCFDPSPS